MKKILKNHGFINIRTASLFAIVLIMSSCSKWIVPAEYVGKWESNRQEITVRTKASHEPFVFTSGYAEVSVTINADKTASGRIGSAHFSNAIVKKNRGLPWDKNVSPAYIIRCGSIGKIFATDPLNQKEVEIWFAPINNNGISNSELRYTQNGAQFPMADIMFMKVKK